MNTKELKNRLKSYRMQKKLKQKINKIHTKQYSHKKIDKHDKKRIYEYWKPYSYLSSLKWHEIYTSIAPQNQHYFMEDFIPEDAFYMEIEPFLNNLNLSKAYQDKNIYHKIFDKNTMPKVMLRNMHGIFYDEDYNKINSMKVENIFGTEDKVCIVKPSLNTQKGNKVKKIHVKDGKMYIDGKKYENFNVLTDIYGKDFLIQENINQHHILSSIYEYSLNTIRIITLRLNDNISCISAVIRFGNEKRIVDNRGIASGINDSGYINTFATDLNLDVYYRHPFNNREFGGIQIPNYDALMDFVKSMHRKLFYFDMVSWDIALDENGEFKMIEFNLKGQEINFHQVNNGPLFGELTIPVLKEAYNK